MKSLLSRLSLLFASLLPVLPVAAGSPVWKVVKDGHTIYLAGSVHILASNQYPLPGGFDEAYSRSQVIVLEADVAKIQSPEFMSAAMARLTYPAPSSIRDRLEPDTLEALEAYFSERGVPFERLERFRPGLLTSTMLVFELQRLGLVGPGADLFVQKRAAEDEKPRIYLETVEQQIDFLAEMGDGEEDAVIRQSLADMKHLPEFWKEMLSSWREGDFDRLHVMTATDMQRDSPETYAELVTKRNHAWLKKLERMLADAPTELVVVGALHLGGDDGLLKLLAARGYKVEQLP